MPITKGRWYINSPNTAVQPMNNNNDYDNKMSLKVHEWHSYLSCKQSSYNWT